MKPVIAVFNNPTTAHRAVDELLARGMHREDISLLASDHLASHQFDLRVGHKGAESIAWGMAAGVPIGAMLGAFIAFASGPLDSPGAFPMVTILLAAVLGMAIGGAIGGALGVGKPKIEAELRFGGHPDVDVNTALVGVRVDTEEEVRLAQNALERMGGAVRS